MKKGTRTGFLLLYSPFSFLPAQAALQITRGIVIDDKHVIGIPFKFTVAIALATIRINRNIATIH